MTESPPADVSVSVSANAAGHQFVGPAVSNEPLPPARTLFVWDFDWTIVNCNSDEYVPSRFLGDAETERRLRRLYRPNKWHECVSALINSCVAEEGRSRMDIHDAAVDMPYLVDVRASLEDVASKKLDCGQMIISDGNDGFIGAFLEKNSLAQCFSHGIETNSAVWSRKEYGIEGGDAKECDNFSVVHQSSKYGGHTCTKCPNNLCKSQVLRDVLSRVTRSSPDDGMATGRPRIVYVGDGSNDACPALNVMIEGDVLLARDGKKIGDPNSKSGPQHDENGVDASVGAGTGDFPILSTLKKAEKNEALVPKCRVHAWNSGKELRSFIKDLLDEI